MKLQLQQGNTLEEYRLKDSVPPTPCLEVKQDNKIVGYLKLGTSGRSKFTFNDLYIQFSEQNIYAATQVSIRIFDTYLNKIKDINVGSIKNLDGFAGFSKNEIYAIDDLQPPNIYKFSNDTLSYNILGTASYNYTSKHIVVDAFGDIYIPFQKVDTKDYIIEKYDQAMNLIWAMNMKGLRNIGIDQNYYVYVNVNGSIRSFFRNGDLYDRINETKYMQYVSNDNCIYITENNILYVRNRWFDLRKTVSINCTNIERIFVNKNGKVGIIADT